MRDISYQLYSSRNFPPLSDTLMMLRDLGYAGVEGYGGLFETDAATDMLRAALDMTGLKMPTAHIGLDALQADPERILALAHTLGMTGVFVPFTPNQSRDAAGWAAFGQELAEAGKPVLEAGLAFGWHNHAFEFADLGGAERPLELILAASDDLALELDVAWVARAGEDPLYWIDRLGERILSVHVKDIALPGEADDEDGWADPGHGTLDWPAIADALTRTPAQHYIVEHDNPSDHRRFASRAIEAARSF
ncbi:MAG: sugar phosphate isomerase/epimerase [Pseudomonadota bacterium]